MPTLKLKYGSEKIGFELPESMVQLNVTEPKADIQDSQFVNELKASLGNSSRDFSKVLIVVADKTRLCQYDKYLPLLIEVLVSEGCLKENISFAIAYGTHPAQSDEESVKAYGKTFNEFPFLHHDSSDESAMQHLGETAFGTHVAINKAVTEASLIITMGAISHHYFAAFGGGRKLLFPGLAAKSSIYQNHSLFLDFSNKRLQPSCQPGNLEGNPLAEDLRLIDSVMPSRISIHGILNSMGQVCQMRIGETYGDFLVACREHDHYYRSPESRQFDMVVATAGGFPKDINYIQSHKSFHNAAKFVKDGGQLILLAECRDGIGNDAFMPFFEFPDTASIYETMQKKYQGNGGTALATMEKAARIQASFVTDLNQELCDKMGINKIGFKKAQELILAHKGSMAFIPNASMLIR